MTALLSPDPDFWAVLVPELSVRDITASRAFYVDVLGFAVKFERPEDNFIYLEMGQAQIMLEQIDDTPGGTWKTAPLDPPLGRGVNFQIEVQDATTLCDRVVAAGHALFRPLATAWYRDGDIENGQTEFLVQDPDGYLLRFMQHLGTRPVQGHP
ncbi:bleomycin resistance protein [Pseudooctadecabacter sp.]|uniref:bleomycin resistance protein n=1 Tax=Pseudooctadecabacter sp. TaxID=1966338 RepID=UPI0025E68963|nr:VOC family protein [Pseudooctadecabacter sp.]